MTTTLAPPDAGLLAWYDALDEDPPGHRIEVLEGVLIVSPSASRKHQDRAHGLKNIMDLATRDAGLVAVEDIEWHLEHPVTGLGSRPRPDVSVYDADEAGAEEADAPRLVTVEVLSPADSERLVPGEPETRIEGKRRAYAYGGTQVHVEIDEHDGIVEARWFEARDGVLVEAGSARGDEPLDVGGPVPFSFIPAGLEVWLRQRVQQLQARAASAEQRADDERARADRAEAELRRLQDQGR
jgi:hypothetical protein